MNQESFLTDALVKRHEAETAALPQNPPRGVVPTAPAYVIINGKMLSICPICSNIIRLNKPLLGDIHLCLTDEEIRQRSRPLP